MNIAFLYANNPPFSKDTHSEKGLGGSESGFVRTIEYLLSMGHKIDVFNQLETPPTEYGDNLVWSNIRYFDRSKPYDVAYSLRHTEVFEPRIAAKLKVLFLADTESHGLGNFVQDGKIDLVMGVSHWQSDKISSEENIPGDYMYVTSNGIMHLSNEQAPHIRVPGNCLFTATPDRLGSLLDIWPAVHSQAPHATLHVYSSFMGWGMSAEDNEASLKDLYVNMASVPGVVNHRHGNPQEIRAAQQEAVLYLYPSDFRETCCMSVLEAMLNGCVPIVTGRAALLEKVIDGITGYVVPAYGDQTQRYKDIFIEKTVRALRDENKEMSSISDNAARLARRFTYDKLVPEWAAEWERRLAEKGVR